MSSRLDFSQLFNKLKESKNPLIKPLIPITISPIFPILFKNGVSVLTHPERRIVGNLASFLAAQIARENAKKTQNDKHVFILHLCLEQYVEELFINYLSLFSNEKIRNLNNKNYSIDNLQKVIEKMQRDIEIVPISPSNSLSNDISNIVNDKFKEKTYDLIILEGLDKAFAIDSRTVLVKNLLSNLSYKAQELDIPIVCAFKEDNLEEQEKIQYIKLSGSKNKLTVQFKDKKAFLIKNDDYCYFLPDFSKANKSQEDQVCIGYDNNSHSYTYKNFSEYSKKIIFDNSQNSINQYIELFYKLNNNYKNDFKVFANEETPELKDIYSHSDSLVLKLKSLYFEMTERQKVLKGITLEEYEKDSKIILKKHFVIISDLDMQELISFDKRYYDSKKSPEYLIWLSKLLPECHKYGIIINISFKNFSILKYDNVEFFGFKEHIHVENLYNNILQISPDESPDLHKMILASIELGDGKVRDDLLDKNPLKKFKSIYSPTKEEILLISKSPLLKDHISYGFDEASHELFLLNPLFSPGALYVGGMGSGKSLALRSTLLIHYLSNYQNTEYHLVDPLKGMSDYTMFFNKPNVHTYLNDINLFAQLMIKLDLELKTRKQAFNDENCNNIENYNKRGKQQLKTIIVAIEELSAIISSASFHYNSQSTVQNTPAYMLKEMLRIGRSYGIIFLLASQRATVSDFPSSLKPGISQIMAFRTNNTSDTVNLNLTHSQDITLHQRGRCAYEHGYLQFPNIDDSMAKELLDTV